MYSLHFFSGNASAAPHMMPEEMGVPFELVLVDRKTEAQKCPDYLKINPAGRIPTLVDDDAAIFEPAAIVLHLADRHPGAHLAPAVGTPERAQFYQWESGPGLVAGSLHGRLDMAVLSGGTH